MGPLVLGEGTLPLFHKAVVNRIDRLLYMKSLRVCSYATVVTNYFKGISTPVAENVCNLLMNGWIDYRKYV